MLRALFALVIFWHGLIHILGFVKGFNLAQIKELTLHISKPMGVMWLLSAILLLVTTFFYLWGKDYWAAIALPALALSQTLVFLHWKDAKFGTIPNLILLIAVIVGYGVWTFNAMAREEIERNIAQITSSQKILTEEAISHLPPIVQKWLLRSNAVGKEIVSKAYLKQEGSMRTTPEGKWMSVSAEQWFAVEKPGFIWRAKVTAFPGVFIAGRDKYENEKGNMLIKLMGLFTIADAQGEEINQGTLVRYLSEIIWFPSAAISEYITWEEAGPNVARATINYGGIPAQGEFSFDENGDFISFKAKRYYDRKEGATLEDWQVSIEPNAYKEFEGVRVPVKGGVTWKLKEGDFNWYNLEISDLKYNSSVGYELSPL